MFGVRGREVMLFSQPRPVTKILQPKGGYELEAFAAGLAEDAFLILPHPEVVEYFRRKADDYERWIRGMRRLQARFPGGIG